MKKTVNPGKVKPKMFKCFNIAVIICVVTIALSACTHGLQSGTDQEPDNSGIKISGGSKKVDWQYESPKVLQITGDDITISGTVTKDLKIECMDASKLTIQDLKRGAHRLDVLAYEDITVDLLGSNELGSIKSLESMTIRGAGKPADLLLYNEASAKNLNINDARICAARFTASGNFELAGSAVVSVKKMDDADEKSLAARVQAFGNININMETGGRLEIEAADGVLPLSARGRIILGEKNKILVPENGEILNAEDSLGDSIICDSQGNDATNVIIEKR